MTGEEFVNRLRAVTEGLEEISRVVRSRPRCSECGRPWLNVRERWRSYLDCDDELVHFCPDCAEEEFGDG
jgi:hypothetical protein